MEDERSQLEKMGWVVITVVSNASAIPALTVLWRDQQIFPFFVGCFTLLCSVMYHLCDSLQIYGADGIWLGEGAWHRLDNVGSIMIFAVFFVYLMDFEDPRYEALVQYFSFGIVILLQEKAPWNIWFTVAPIVAIALLWIAKRLVADGHFAKISHVELLRRGVAWQALGALCFVRALDDKNDPLRIFHGGWHLFSGIAAFYNWQILRPQRKIHLRA